MRTRSHRSPIRIQLLCSCVLFVAVTGSGNSERAAVRAASPISAESNRSAAKSPHESTGDQTPIQSGPTAGKTIQQFFVRAVTGPHRNRSVCYVCRYGSRPVVMVMIQKVDPKLPDLLKAIDEVVDENRVAGLRSFGVLVTDESSQAVPILQTIAFDERIRMPLTAATSAVAGPNSHNLHKDAATTIILYRDQEAHRSLAFRRGEISQKSIAKIVADIESLIRPAEIRRASD